MIPSLYSTYSWGLFIFFPHHITFHVQVNQITPILMKVINTIVDVLLQIKLFDFGSL